MNKKVLVPIARGSEELEAVAIIDVLRRADISVKVAGENEIITCSRGIKIIPDLLLDYISDEDIFDAVVLPGGLKGVENLSANDHLENIIEAHIRENKLVCAICAAPLVLADRKFLPTGAVITSHPGVKPQLKKFQYSDDRVVEYGNFITSRGPGTAIELALRIVEKLAGTDVADKIASAMLHK